MPDPRNPKADPPSSDEGREHNQTEGDSAGYGSGGSTRDYQEVVGENPVTAGRPNPLDVVIPPGPQGNQDNRDQEKEGT